MRFFAIIFVLLFQSVPNFASVFPRAFDRSSEVMEFRDSGTERDFLRLDDHQKELIYTELLYARFVNSRLDRSKWMYTKLLDEDLIIDKYFANASFEVKQAVFQNLFVYAIESGNAEAANHFFVLNSPSHYGAVLCRAIENIAAPYGADQIPFKEAFEAFPDRIKGVLPFVAAHNLQNSQCRGVNESDQEIQISVHQILLLTAPEVAAEYRRTVVTDKNQSKVPGPAPHSVSALNCDRKNLEWYFSDVLTKLDRKIGSSYFLYVRSERCTVQGIAHSLRSGFEFHLNYGVIGPQKAVIKFKNVNEIVNQLLTLR